jgi:putative tryptophan/tyrosine transport system substrate-binding protein
MRRREFIALIGGAAAAWPLSVRGQQAKPPTIGFMGESTPEGQRQWVAAFVQRLGERGWNEGRNVAIEYRWAGGHNERFAEIVADLVGLKVDVIVTQGTPAVLAAKQATSLIPVVFAIAGNPVANGLVASLARPGSNVTGLTNQSAELAGKRIELLREVRPGLRRLGIMANVDNPSVVLDVREVQAAAQTLGLDTTTADIRRAADIAGAFAAVTGRVEALYVAGDPLVTTNRTRLAILAAGARLPTIHPNRENTDAGGLMSYGPNLPDLHRRAADFVDKILRGARPGDLPVEQPTKYDLVINLVTATALGLEIPPNLIARADEVIE